MKNNRNDDYEYLGLLLEGIQGSLIEERHSSTPKSYKKLEKQYRSLNRLHSLPISQILDEPSVLDNKLAELAALFPMLQIDMRMIGMQKILGKGQKKKLKNLFLFLSVWEGPAYIKFIIETQLSKLIPQGPQEGIGAELQFIYKVSMLEKSQRIDIIHKLYSKHNLQKQIELGYLIFTKDLKLQFFPSGSVKIAARKRGYNEKGSTSSKAEKERKRSMEEINRQVEEQRQRILQKQMLIFESTLDQILAVQSADNRGEIKEIIRNQNEQISKLHPKEEKDNESGTEK